MSNTYNFNQMVSDFIKNLVEEYQSQGKQFVIAKGNKLEDVTEAFHSGSLRPLLMWQLDNRRFEMFEGYRRTGPVDWFRHNSRVSLTADSSMLLGSRVLDIEPANLSMSKQDFLLHIADAMHSLYESSPAGNVYLDENKEIKFTQHLNEKEQEYQEKIANMRVLNPVINQYHQWRALYESFSIAVIQDPNIIQEHSFDYGITYQLVRERLEQLNGVVLPSELYGKNFEPYHQQLAEFMREKAVVQANTNTQTQENTMKSTPKLNNGMAR